MMQEIKKENDTAPNSYTTSTSATIGTGESCSFTSFWCKYYLPCGYCQLKKETCSQYSTPNYPSYPSYPGYPWITWNGTEVTCEYINNDSITGVIDKDKIK